VLTIDSIEQSGVAVAVGVPVWVAVAVAVGVSVGVAVSVAGGTSEAVGVSEGVADARASAGGRLTTREERKGLVDITRAGQSWSKTAGLWGDQLGG
jgi:hypothetical protein